MNNELLLALRKIKAISDYQFGPEVFNAFFDEIENIRIERSKNTGKMKHVYYKGNLILNLKPNNGFFTLSLFLAKIIINKIPAPKLRVIVLTEISEYIKKGRNVFCKHVVDIDDNLRPMDEVIVVNQEDELLAIGRLKIPVPYVRAFKSGIAVNVRKGAYKSQD